MGTVGGRTETTRNNSGLIHTMKTPSMLARLFAGLLLMMALQRSETGAAEVPQTPRPKIYDESLDGSKQIADALTTAKKKNQRVLLQFGANWCNWCHLLHKLFATDKAIMERLKADYVVVLIDVNQAHNKDIDTKYGNPTRFGLPVLVILDADGKQLTTKNTAELEQGRQHDPDKVLAFLKQWAPKKPQ